MAKVPLISLNCVTSNTAGSEEGWGSRGGVGGDGEEEGERQALIQNMAKRLSMHGKLLLSEVPIYRVNTLRNCFYDPSPFPHPCGLPTWVGLELKGPREVLLLQGSLQSPPSFVARGRRAGSESPGLCPPSWAPSNGAEACA